MIIQIKSEELIVIADALNAIRPYLGELGVKLKRGGDEAWALHSQAVRASMLITKIMEEAIKKEPVDGHHPAH